MLYKREHFYYYWMKYNNASWNLFLLFLKCTWFQTRYDNQLIIIVIIPMELSWQLSWNDSTTIVMIIVIICSQKSNLSLKFLIFWSFSKHSLTIGATSCSKYSLWTWAFSVCLQLLGFALVALASTKLSLESQNTR